MHAAIDEAESGLERSHRTGWSHIYSAITTILLACESEGQQQLSICGKSLAISFIFVDNEVSISSVRARMYDLILLLGCPSTPVFS